MQGWAQGKKKKPEVQYLMGLKLDFKVLRGISTTFCDHNQIMFETRITFQQTYHFDLTQNLNGCVKKSEYSETNLNLSTKIALLKSLLKPKQKKSESKSQVI